jgi:hypothetical protein
MGLSWTKILEYRKIIKYISLKYSSDPDLADDISQEVMLRLFENKNLKLSNFDPNKLDAGLRNTIRNQVLKVLASKKVGRWSVDSLDALKDAGFQIDSHGNITADPTWNSQNLDLYDHDDEHIGGEL